VLAAAAAAALLNRVDVSAVPRLRKLRKSEADKVLDGTDFAGRLKGQFEKIHGRPLWAEKGEWEGVCVCVCVYVYVCV
jgi:hypothetical protein